MSAKALNMQIRRLAGLLPGGLEHEYGFVCECGCGEIAGRSAVEFERDGGAWLDGHRDRPGEGIASVEGRSQAVAPTAHQSSAQ